MVMPEPSSIRIRHDKKGIPYVRFRLGQDQDGKPLRYFKRFTGMTDDEAQMAAREFYESVSKGTLKEALADYNRTKGTPNTVKTYGYYARRLAAPISSMPVASVDVPTLNRLFRDLLKTGTGKGKEGALSPTTVNGFKRYLSGAFRYFVSMKMIATNPVSETIKIQVARNESLALDDESTAKLIKWVEREIVADCETQPQELRRNMAFAIWLSLITGARAGEICAIRRKDINPRKRTLSINGTATLAGGVVVRQDHTKGRKPRTLDLLDSQLETIRTHESWQQGYIAGCGPNTPIVTVDGCFTSPKTLSEQFRRVARELGLDPQYHFHSLRHTNATLMLQDGVNPSLVQQRIGHADASTTLQFYGHAIAGHGSEAAKSVEDSLETIRDWG